MTMNSPSSVPFADQLAGAVRRCKNPTVVGLDPRAESLPDPLRPTAGASRAEIAAAYTTFCTDIIDAVADLVPAVKPQAAFFEQIGHHGMTALARTIQYAADKGLLVILDGKRNDIGTTAEAYADAYLGRDHSAWHSDALTVNPYLGDDSLEPFVKVCQARNAGIFVLVKTSNPGSGAFQDRLIDGQPLYRHVAGMVEQLSQQNLGASQFGCAGAVVGATYPDQLAELRAAMPHCWFLVPGFGSQGGTAQDTAAAFRSDGLGAVINNSRGIIFAHARAPYKDQFRPSQWQRAVEQATRDMLEQLRAETPVGQL
jgi:orotidine-5'-phosphate decarboxylase